MPAAAQLVPALQCQTVTVPLAGWQLQRKVACRRRACACSCGWAYLVNAWQPASRSCCQWGSCGEGAINKAHCARGAMTFYAVLFRRIRPRAHGMRCCGPWSHGGHAWRAIQTSTRPKFGRARPAAALTQVAPAAESRFFLRWMSDCRHSARYSAQGLARVPPVPPSPHRDSQPRLPSLAAGNGCARAPRVDAAILLPPRWPRSPLARL